MSKTRDITICHAYSFAFGVVGIGLVPGLVKPFEESYALSHTQMGTILAGAGALCTVCALFFGLAADRHGSRPLLLGCMSLLIVSAACLWWVQERWFAIAALLLFHAGHAGYAVVNSLTFVLYGARSAHGLNLLHCFQGIGRLLAPLLIAGVVALTGAWEYVFLISAVMHVLFLVSFYRMGEWHVDASRNDAPAWKGLAALADRWILLGVAAFAFLAGCELTLMTWLADYLEREAGFAQSQALVGLTVMMVGYTAIRFVLGLVRLSVGPAFMLATLALLVGCCACLAWARSPALVYSACGLMGLSFGCYWPQAASLLFERLPGGRGFLAGLFNMGSTLGMMVFLALVGYLADRSALSVIFLIAPTSGAAFVAVFIGFARRPAIAG